MPVDSRYTELNARLMGLLAEVDAVAIELGNRRNELLWQLEQRGPIPELLEDILAGLHDPDPDTRYLALAGLSQRETQYRSEVVKPLLDRAKERKLPYAKVKPLLARRELARGDPVPQRVRELALGDSDPHVQTFAIGFLSDYFKQPELIEVELYRGLGRVARETDDYFVRHAAFDTLEDFREYPLPFVKPMLGAAGFSPLRYNPDTAQSAAEFKVPPPRDQPRVWDRLLPWRRDRRAV